MRINTDFLDGWDHAIKRINDRHKELYEELKRTPDWRYFKLSRLYRAMTVLHELSQQLHEEWLDASEEEYVRVR